MIVKFQSTESPRDRFGHYLSVDQFFSLPVKTRALKVLCSFSESTSRRIRHSLKRAGYRPQLSFRFAHTSPSAYKRSSHITVPYQGCFFLQGTFLYSEQLTVINTSDNC